MVEQRHRIKRQVLELRVADEQQARRLYPEVSRIYHQRVVPLLDQCLSGLSQPDQLHRIESLTLDLGTLNPARLEEEWVAQLSRQLRAALAARMARPENKAGGDRAETSQLELLSSFLYRGHLPWWSDPSAPDLLRDLLSRLIQQSPRALVDLMRAVAREAELLARLVRHYDDTMLGRIGRLLAPAQAASLQDLPETLARLLAGTRAQGQGRSAIQLRHLLWQSMLRAATLESAHGQGTESFWREVVRQIALQSGGTYDRTLVDLRRALEQRRGPPGKAPAPQDLGSVLEDLYQVLPGEPTAGEAARSAPRHPGPAVDLGDRAESSQLERLSSFLYRGHLPGRSDPSAPDRLPDLLNSLIQQSPRALVGLMQAVAREAEPLARLVRHCDEAMLGRLGRLLAPAASLEALPGALARLLSGTPIEDQIGSAIQLRHLLWQSMLRAASLEAAHGPGMQAFWREVVRQLALQSGGTYDQTRVDLRRALAQRRGPSGKASAPEGLGSVLEDLYQALPGEAAAGEAARSAPTPPGPAVDPSVEIAEILGRLTRGNTPLTPLLEALRPLATRLPPPLQVEWLRPLRALHGRRNAPRYWADLDAVQALARLIQPPAVRRQLPSNVLGGLLRDFRQAAEADLSPAAAEALTGLALAVPGEATGLRPRPIPADRSFSEADERYVENAGLVILWPFLGHFFGHLGLLEEKRFKDPAASQRALALLQYLASEDPAPPEYLLGLNKVLCGMDPNALFDLAEPLTDAEAEECTRLLGAVIARAPVLGKMSLAGFRGSFLLRQGVLSIRDGAWLLHVERAAYDLVLDRFPWSVGWVKLPWMQAPLWVEW